MKRVLTIFAVTICIALSGLAKAQTLDKHFKIDSQKPSVYIAFEKIGHRTPLRKDEKGSGVFLRLHNNLRASIRFCAFGIQNGVQMAFYSDDLEIGLNYEVEREVEDSGLGTSSVSKRKQRPPDLPIGYLTGGLCHYFELMPGKSLLFSVPSEHLADGLIIKIPFNYQWEETSEEKPEHFIRFYSSDLPGRRN